MKKSWRKPELLVLVRSRREEAILDTCKTPTGGGPNDVWDRCGWGEPCYCWCAESAPS
jgi:hypothetical protein